MANILIIDDEQSIGWGLTRLAESLGHQAWAFASVEEALMHTGECRPDVVFLDVRLPGVDGLTAMADLRRRCRDVPILVMTAYGDLTTAVRAIRQGAFEYIVKPFDLEKARAAILRATDQSGAGLPPGSDSESAETMLGSSPPMQRVFRDVALAARSAVNVVLFGESGTGKELAARAIHGNSDRADGPFVAVNMASLSPTLFESELFGHVRGAFTGAERQHVGLLEQARQGTLFIDEIAEVPAAIQAKLLRVLEHDEFVPVGGTQARRTDFRVISATHRDLPQCVASGAFRHDLYFRLCGFQINLPPLRDREDDVVTLAQSFLALLGGEGRRFSEETLAEIRKRPWYGNVRELRNAVAHATTVVRAGAILPEHLPPAAPASLAGLTESEGSASERLARQAVAWAEASLAGEMPAGSIHAEMLRLVEPPLFHAALESQNGNCASAARILGLHRTTLRKKLDAYRRQG